MLDGGDGPQVTAGVDAGETGRAGGAERLAQRGVGRQVIQSGIQQQILGVVEHNLKQASIVTGVLILVYAVIVYLWRRKRYSSL